MDELRLRASAALARSLEHLGTRLEAALDLPVVASADRLTQGSFALTHRHALPTDGLTAGLEYAVDDNRSERRTAADELLGRVRRDRLAWSASWQHAFDERWSAQASAGDTRVGFGDAAGAAGWREFRASLSTSWRADEVSTLGASLSRSAYRLADGDTRSDTDSLNLSVTRALDERSSVSLGVGGYRTQAERVLRALACPLPLPLCEAGLVAPVPVALAVASRTQGTQYSAEWQWAADERRQLSVAANRQLSPSALGVSRTDAVNVGVRHAWTPTLDQSFALARSASRTPLADGAPLALTLQTLETEARWQLGQAWSLAGAARWQRLVADGPGSGGRTLRFSISLQYQAPRIVANR